MTSIYSRVRGTAVAALVVSCLILGLAGCAPEMDSPETSAAAPPADSTAATSESLAPVTDDEKAETAQTEMKTKLDSDQPGEKAMRERAVLAGGCFWGMEDLIRDLPGILDTRVGYTGGDVPNATYRNHGTHAEAIEIYFDPSLVSYRQLLEFFFQIHDPTTLNRQGNDRGTSYRSAIFYTSPEQKEIAMETIADVNASGRWPGKVVTEVAEASDFWEAEPEHQDYLERYPNGYTCHFVRPNWVLPAKDEAKP